MRHATPHTRTVWGALVATILLAALALTSSDAQAQQRPNPASYRDVAGTTFVVAFPDTTANQHDETRIAHLFDDYAMISFYSAVPTKVTIRGANGYVKTVENAGNQFSHINLASTEFRAARSIVFESGRPVNTTFRIESEQPIVVYCYLMTEFGAEAWTPLPVEAWGNEYYAAALPGDYVYDISSQAWVVVSPAPAEILVIAAFNGTQVTILPNGRLNKFPPTTVLLNAGEAYQVQSYVDTREEALTAPQVDLGGSRIVATKPVGVITGNTRTLVIDEQLGILKNPMKNCLFEWLAPVELHGTEFVYMPTWDGRQPVGSRSGEGSRKAEFVRVYGTQIDGTVGFRIPAGGGGGFPLGPVGQGQFEELRLPPIAAQYFRTEQPTQMMMHSSAISRYLGAVPEQRDPPPPPPPGGGEPPPPEPEPEGKFSGMFEAIGPYMVEMVPREQWSSFAPFYAPPTPGEFDHFVNIVTDTASAMKVFLNDGSRFVFNRGVIEGTDLIWGVMGVRAGQDYWVEGRDGARFYGFA